jgi:hypothetical protein
LGEDITLGNSFEVENLWEKVDLERNPLSPELGTYRTVKAGFWSWPTGTSA